MPKIEHRSSPSDAGYNALRPPELPPRPAGGLRGRTVRSGTTERHEHLSGRPVGEAALRLAGAKQKELGARAVAVAPPSSERFLPGRRNASGEPAYERLRPTASADHVYEQVAARTHTPSADPRREFAPAGDAGGDPRYEFAPPGHPDEPHYEFAPPGHPDAEPVDAAGVSRPTSPLDEPHGESLAEAGTEEPHYEFAPQDPTTGEHVYDTIEDSDYEPPAPSGLGSVNGLGVYLDNGLERGTIPETLKTDLQTALVYAKQLDQDIGRVATLLGKLDAPRGALTVSEGREVQSLIAANKHNLALVQTWLAHRADELRETGDLTPQTEAFMNALQTRIADRHMDIADLTCLYDLDEAPPLEPVSREDRCNAHLLDAQAAVVVARSLPDVDPAVKDRLVADLEGHRDLLLQLKDAAGDRLEIPGDGRLALAAKELWQTPVPLQKSGAGASRDVAALRDGWRRNPDAPLPVAHAKVGQARMLQEFMRFRLGAAKAGDGGPDLRRLFHEAKNQVINAQPWETVTNQVRTSMPAEPARGVTVQSRIVPGKAFAKRLAEDYPSNGVNCSDRTQYKHVPNLAQTTLTNSSGEVLFSGFRHGVLDPYDIDAEHLASLPDDALRRMIADLAAPEETAGGAGEAFVEQQLAQIRSGPEAAQRLAAIMRQRASGAMATEMAAAALVADPDTLDAALSGETVDVALSSISLLTPDSLRRLGGSARSDERTMLNHQTGALRNLAEGNPVELRVRDEDGALRTVKVNVRLRQFNFGVNAGAVGRARAGPVSIPSQTPGWRNLMGWGFAMDRNNPELERLFGGANAEALGGDVAERLFEMRNQRAALAQELDDTEAYIALEESDDRPDLQQEAATQRAELATLNKRIESLDGAARQAKAIWASNDYRRGGGDPFKMVSRLALIGHLMGETPLFNCKSGKDRTGQLDAEVKFLATAADESGGTVPAPDESMEAWRGVRNDFVFNTGNLEMQRLNTGLPGYKLKDVPGLANFIGDGMKPLYRGGSAYVSA